MDSLRQHIETLQKENATLKKRHAGEVRQLKAELATLQADVTRALSLATDRANSASTANTLARLGRSGSGLALDSTTGSGGGGGGGTASHLTPPNRSPRGVSPLRGGGPPASAAAFKPVMTDASTQCSSFVIPSGATVVGGAASTGGSRTSDIAALTKEADRLLAAIHTLREERTPLKRSKSGSAVKRTSSPGVSVTRQGSSQAPSGETPNSTSRLAPGVSPLVNGNRTSSPAPKPQTLSPAHQTQLFPSSSTGAR